MKLPRKWSIGLLSLAVAVIGTVMVASAQQTPPPQTPAPAPAPAPGTPQTPPKGPAEKHERLRKAIEELRAVKLHLEKAPHDFGGHREEAVKAVTEAIKQLEIAIKFDKN